MEMPCAAWNMEFSLIGNVSFFILLLQHLVGMPSHGAVGSNLQMLLVVCSPYNHTSQCNPPAGRSVSFRMSLCSALFIPS